MTTYYVSSSGRDSSDGTSKAAPLRTFARAATLLKPGDTLLLRRDNWFSEQLTLTTSRVAVSAYGTGPKPMLYGGGVRLLGSGLRVSKLAVSQCARGFEVLGDQCRIEDVEAFDNMHGVEIGVGADDAVVTRSWLHDNRRMQPNTPGAFDDYGACGVVVCGDRAEVSLNLITGHVARSADFGTDGSAVEIYGGIGTLVYRNNAINNRTFTELGNKRTANTRYVENEVYSELEESEFLITRGVGDPNFGPVRTTAAIGNEVTLKGAKSVGYVTYLGAGPDVLCLYDNLLNVAGEIGRTDGGQIVGGMNTYRRGRKGLMLPGDTWSAT